MCTNKTLSSISSIQSLIWTKDKVTIPAHDLRLNSTNGTLLIEQVRENDTGTYVCTLRAAGYLSIRNITLHVIGKPINLGSFSKRTSLSYHIPSLPIPLRGFLAACIKSCIPQTGNLSSKVFSPGLKNLLLLNFTLEKGKSAIFSSNPRSSQCS